MSILLGFEIPTGRRVEIPDEGHAAFFGQTQLSGKTTLIEAITYRAPSTVKAVAFITKRGEGSFLTARTIPPYFSEPTNDPEQPLWRWVSAILEASQQRKLRFEESWIIRACEEPRHAKSLADVHQNIKSLLEGQGDYFQKTKKKRVWHWARKPVTGITHGVYTSLKAYFDIVMPQLERMPYTKTLDLEPGLNVMDLREYSMEAQGMVIRSVMEYLYRHERNTRVIVPEAQDFVPQGKNSPVKMACETMVRKGAADKNFMWLDSQDMAAVDKVMLRAVSILGCGVQGEAHEMGRAIAHLFGVATKLTPRDIGSLKIGQFFLRLAGGEVTKVYVQPAWMESEVHARAIAMGQESVTSARQILKKFKEERENDAEDNQVGKAEYYSDHVKAESSNPPPQSIHNEQRDDDPANQVPPGNGDRIHPEGSGDIGQGDQRCDPNDGVDEMWKENYDELRAMYTDLLVKYERLVSSSKGQGSSLENAGATRPPAEGSGAGNGAKTPLPAPGPDWYSKHDLETIYHHILARAAKDPGILQLLAAKPELRVTVQRTVIELEDTTLAGKCARLIYKGFFKSPMGVAATQKELRRLGSDQPTTNVRRALEKLNEQGFLTAEADGYQAVEDMKINLIEQK